MAAGLMSSPRHLNTDEFVYRIADQLRDSDCDVYLILPGIDGRYARAAHQLMAALLHPLLGTEMQAGCLTASEEECICLISLVPSLHVRWIAPNQLAPDISHNIPIVVSRPESLQGETEVDDEAQETFKIMAFVQAMHELRAGQTRKLRVAVPVEINSARPSLDFPLLGADSALEKWPMVQAFALQEYSQLGFFTMAFDVYDASAGVAPLLAEASPAQVLKAHAVASMEAVAAWKQLTSTLATTSIRSRGCLSLEDAVGALRAWAELREMSAAAHLRTAQSGKAHPTPPAVQYSSSLQVLALSYDGTDVSDKPGVLLSAVSHMQVRFRDACTGVQWTRCIKLGSQHIPQVDNMYAFLARFSSSASAACSRYVSRLLAGVASQAKLQDAVRRATRAAVQLTPAQDLCELCRLLGVEVDHVIVQAGSRPLKDAVGKQRMSEITDKLADLLLVTVDLTGIHGIRLMSTESELHADGEIRLPGSVVMAVAVSARAPEHGAVGQYWPSIADSVLLTPTAAAIPQPNSTLQSAAHSVLSGVSPLSHTLQSEQDRPGAADALGAVVSHDELQAWKVKNCSCSNDGVVCACAVSCLKPRYPNGMAMSLLSACGALTGMPAAALTDSINKQTCFACSADDLDDATALLQALGGGVEALAGLGAPLAHASSTSDRAGHVRIRGGEPIESLTMQAPGCVVAVRMDKAGQVHSTCAHVLSALDLRQRGFVAHTAGTAPVQVCMQADVQDMFVLSDDEWKAAAASSSKAGQAGLWCALAPVAQLKQAVACMATQSIVNPDCESPSASSMWRQFPRAAGALHDAAGGGLRCERALPHFLQDTIGTAAAKPIVPRVFGFSLADGAGSALCGRLGVHVDDGAGEWGQCLLLLVLHPDAAAVTPLQTALPEWTTIWKDHRQESSAAVFERSLAAVAVVAATRGMVGAAHAAALRAWSHALCCDQGHNKARSSVCIAPDIQHQHPAASSVHLPLATILVPGACKVRAVTASQALCAATSSSIHWEHCVVPDHLDVQAAVQYVLGELQSHCAVQHSFDRAQACPVVHCVTQGGRTLRMLDTHAISKQQGLCIVLPSFMCAPAFAGCLQMSCGEAAAMAGVEPWPLTVAPSAVGGQPTTRLLPILRGIMPAVDVSDLFLDCSPGTPATWLLNAALHPATRVLLNTAPAHNKADASNSSVVAQPPAPPVATKPVRAPPVPGAALAAVLSAGGSSPFAPRVKQTRDAQAQQDEKEAMSIKAYQDRKAATRAAAFPSLQRAASVHPAATALLASCGVVVTPLQGPQGIDVTHELPDDFLSRLANLPVEKPRLTLQTAKRILGCVTWPTQPETLQLSVACCTELHTVLAQQQSAVLFTSLVRWLQQSLSCAPPPRSASCALQPPARESELSKFLAHILVIVPDHEHEIPVFIQASYSLGIRVFPAAAATALCPELQLGQVQVASRNHSMTEHVLGEWLQQCQPVQAPDQPAFTKSSLSRAQRLVLVRHRKSEPLPEGVLFDGQCFRDPMGRTLLQHPRQDEFISDFLCWANERVADANAKRASAAGGAAAAYWSAKQVPQLDIEELLSTYVQRD